MLLQLRLINTWIDIITRKWWINFSIWLNLKACYFTKSNQKMLIGFANDLETYFLNIRAITTRTTFFSFKRYCKNITLRRHFSCFSPLHTNWMIRGWLQLPWKHLMCSFLPTLLRIFSKCVYRCHLCMRWIHCIAFSKAFLLCLLKTMDKQEKLFKNAA